MKRDYANELDLLRFLAALAVTMFHLSIHSSRAYGVTGIDMQPFLAMARYGYMGVDLFFMISGFVVVASAQNATLRSFIAGRVTRLYPAFWFCCTLTFVALTATGRFPDLTLGTYLANMTMEPHLFSVSYMDTTYWTLAIELRFYFLLACLFVIGQVRNIEQWTVGWLITAIVLTIVPIPALANKLLVPYASYFVAGALFHFIRADGITPPRLVCLTASLLLSMNHAVDTIRAQPAYADRSPGVACALTVLFFVMFAVIATRNTGAFGQRKWVTLGLLTYPLYLIHQLAAHVVFSELNPELDPRLAFWLAMAASIAGAYLVHRYVEVPFAPRLRRLFPVARQTALALALKFK